jgi:hypothetical protein
MEALADTKKEAVKGENQRGGCPNCFPGCVLEVVVIGLDALELKRFLKSAVNR